MRSITYLSTALGAWDGTELALLLRDARSHNERLGLTGMLLYRGGRFAQTLEGEPAAVAETFDRIAGDPRHENVVVLADETIAARRYADWTMGFRDATDVPEHELDEAAPFLRLAQPVPDEPDSRSQQLLNLFRSGAI